MRNYLIHLLVGVCYRSPSATTEESMQLTKVIETAANNCALIFGDFNYPSTDLENLDADNSIRYFLDSINDSFLTQHVSSPTRGTNILDLLFTTDPGMVEEIQVRENLANCDHNILTMEVNCKAFICIAANRSRYVLHRGNNDSFRSFLSGIPWTDLLKDCDAIESWDIFKSKMQESMNKFIIKQSAGYVTNKPLRMSYRAFNTKNKKYSYWKKIQESKLHADYVTYKKYQNIAVTETRKAKKSFEKKLSDNIKSDPKSCYAYVRSKSKTIIKIGPLIDFSNRQVEEEEQMCEILNQ